VRNQHITLLTISIVASFTILSSRLPSGRQVNPPGSANQTGTPISQRLSSGISKETTNAAKQALDKRVTELQKNFIDEILTIQGLYTAQNYAKAVTAINQLFATPQYLPTTAELATALYVTNAQKLGTVITNLITTVGIRSSNKKKLTIKPAYKSSISFESFKKMLTFAKGFARGFTSTQNATIASSLTILKKQ
jgi:hypothetical protein